MGDRTPFPRPARALSLPRRSMRAAVLLLGISTLAAWPGSAPAQPVAHAQASASAKPPAGFASRFATVDGQRIHYVRGGHGSTVVLLHGFPQDWTEWRSQMRALQPEHDVIAVDLPGTGASEVTKGGYDTQTMARRVHGLLTQLGVQDGVQIVAHDIGLWVAYPYAAQWPKEVAQMAVMEAPIPNRSFFKFPALRADGRTAEFHFGFFQKPWAQQLVAGHELAFVRGFIGQFIARRAAFSARDYRYYARLIAEPGRTLAWFKMYRALYKDVRQNARLVMRGKLSMPILAIGGERAFGDEVAKRFRQYADNVRSATLPGAGHWVTEERPEQLNRMLRKFLR